MDCWNGAAKLKRLYLVAGRRSQTEHRLALVAVAVSLSMDKITKY